MRTFTIAMLGLSVAIVAIGLGALMNPTTRVATWTINVSVGLLLIAGCLAAGCRQPARSFWLGFLIVACGMIAANRGLLGVAEVDLFPHQLYKIAEESIISASISGVPGTTKYYQYHDSTYPLKYITFGVDGRLADSGLMTTEEAAAKGVVVSPAMPDAEDCPDADYSYLIFRDLFRTTLGLAGGFLAFTARRRGMRRHAS